MALPVPSPGLFVRASNAANLTLSSLTGWVERALGVGLPAFGGSGGGLPTQPTYDPEKELRALVENPWVWACTQAIVTDLASLPLVVERGRGSDRKQLNDHPVLDLLERPSSRCSGIRFRRQLYADLTLTGNAYVRVWRDTAGNPVRLGRILPSRIAAIVDSEGEEIGWRLKATGQVIGWNDVLHISDISWEENRALVFGASPITPLGLGLKIDKDSQKQSGRAARRGRLEMMLSPDSPEVVLNKSSTEAVVASYVRAGEAGDGVYVVNKNIKATPLTLTSRDGEFLGTRDRLRSEVLATMAVPPTRAGEPAANYGTAKQQSRTYWETLIGRAALIDAELSRLCEPGTRVRHSFANAEALQTSLTERQSRAVIWMEKFGMTAAEAAAYEGFVDAPVRDKPPSPAPGNPGPGASASGDEDPNEEDPTDEPREDRDPPENRESPEWFAQLADLIREDQ